MTEETLQKMLRLPLTKESRKSVHEAIERIRRRRVMTTNIKDLPDEKLIELCAKAQGWDWERMQRNKAEYLAVGDTSIQFVEYNPLASTQAGKAQAMELVERFNIHAYPPIEQEPRWLAVIRHSGCGESENIQRAIVLAVVAFKYGDTIEYDGGKV